MRQIVQFMTHGAVRGALAMAAVVAVAAPHHAFAQSDIVLKASSATGHGKWAKTSDASADGGSKMRHPDAGAAKLTTAQASPADYFEMTFSATAGVPYRLWIHGKRRRRLLGQRLGLRPVLG